MTLAESTSRRKRGAAVVLGEDGIGVVGAVRVDVGDGGVEAVHHFHGDDGGEVFLVPVGLRSLLQVGHAGALQDAQGFRAAAHFHAVAGEHGADAGQRGGGHCARNQQGFVVLQVP